MATAALPPLRAQEAPALPLTHELRWPGTTAYDPAVPTPEEVIGHRIGERHTLPSQAVRYLEAVAAASPRVTVRRHGLTHEGRALVHAVVTTPARQGRLDELQAEHQRLFTDAASFRDGDLTDLPAVAYMGYSIHGNEASGTEAALLTLYHLAAGRGPAVDSVLEGVVTIVDPLFNPDGRDRFVDWANRHRGAVPTTDPQDREHNEPWPQGRTNHYWFDLNRDWLPAQHPESRARLELYYAWRPQVLTDYHEMGSEATYFFQPGIPSRTHPLTPARNQELTGLITDYSARALDRIGSLYYTRESFDDFYYGKGSTYPDVNGAVGILFEQASSRALAREVKAGTLEYGFTVRNQLTASLATLQATAALRGELVAHTAEFYGAGAEAFAKTLDVGAYLLPLAGQPARATELARLLARHRVDVHPVTGPVTAGGRSYAAGQAYVIPAAQRQARLVQAVLEPNLAFVDSLFYDVSTWSLPEAFGVDVERLGAVPTAVGAPLPPPGPTDWPGAPPAGRLVGDADGAYAFVIPHAGAYAPRAAYRCLRAGARVRLVHDPIAVQVGEASYAVPRGSFVVPVAQNDLPADSLRALVRAAVTEDGLDVYAATTGLTPSGPDLGGRSTELLREPQVALVTGDGTSAYRAGETWFALSERLGLPVSLVDADRVGKVDLDRYTHVLLAGGRYVDLDVDALRAWVRDGGTLVAMHTAAAWAVANEFAALTEDELDVDSLVRDLPYAQLDEARGAQGIGGAILRVEVDGTHPLGYGLGADEARGPFDDAGATVYAFRQHADFYRASETPGATVGRYADEPLASGYLSRERRAQAAGKAAIAEAELGGGRVVLIFDAPAFRAFFRGSERVLWNAVVLR